MTARKIGFGLAQDLRDDTLEAALNLRLREESVNRIEAEELLRRRALLQLIRIAMPTSVELVKESMLEAAKSGQSNTNIGWQASVYAYQDVSGFIIESLSGPGLTGLRGTNSERLAILCEGRMIFARELVEEVAFRTASAVQAIDPSLDVLEFARIEEPEEDTKRQLYTYNAGMSVSW